MCKTNSFQAGIFKLLTQQNFLAPLEYKTSYCISPTLVGKCFHCAKGIQVDASWLYLLFSVLFILFIRVYCGSFHDGLITRIANKYVSDGQISENRIDWNYFLSFYSVNINWLVLLFNGWWFKKLQDVESIQFKVYCLVVKKY